MLALLVDRAGEVVTHEEIRAALWPDVTVDFDAGLHHCIRQIRAALGDRAKAPRFIETIPRRGYRLRVDAMGFVEPPPEPAPPEVNAPPTHATTSAPTDREDHAPPEVHAIAPERPALRTPSRRWLPLVLTLLVAALGAWRMRGGEPPELRVAIMAFGSGPAPSVEAERIGEQVLADLANRRPDAAIVGPRTTEPLREQGRSLPQIADELDVAYVLNARHLRDEAAPDAPLLLVELIRTSDGKHVWVRRYDRLARWREIADEVTQGVAETLR